MADITKDDVIEFIANMSVLELSELVKELEDKFGVSAAAPVMMGGAMPAGGDAGAAAEEKTEFDVVIKDAGPKKIEVIKVIRKLTSQGIGVLFISHHLDEMKEIGDRVTVLRNGQWVATKDVAEITVAEVIEMMVGRTMTEGFPFREAVERGQELLSVEGLTYRGNVEPVSLSVREGEIVGVAGLVGSGRTEAMRAIFGADKASAGTIRVRGEEIEVGGPKDAVEAGICLLTEDRERCQGREDHWKLDRQHQAAGTDNRTGLDHGTIHHGGCHADQATVLDGTAVQDRLVTHGDIGTDSYPTAQLLPDVECGGEMIGVYMRFENPLQRQPPVPDEADDLPGTVAADRPGGIVEVQHRVHDGAGRTGFCPCKS